MKKIVICIRLCLFFYLGATAQTLTCHVAPDGTDANGWAYTDYIIPQGYKIDSVYMDAVRPGYSSDQEDFIFEYCQGVTAYDQTLASMPWSYLADTTSEYNHWIDLTGFNYKATGVIRATLPTPGGAIWNKFCLAISPVLHTGIEEDGKTQFELYPNPADGVLKVSGLDGNKVVKIEVMTLTGQVVQEWNVDASSAQISTEDLTTGLYLVKINNAVKKLQVLH